MNKVIDRKAIDESPAVHGRARPKKPGHIRVALMQRESDLGTETHDPRDTNMAVALADIKNAAEQGADLVIFGEMYLSGYRTDEWLHKWATVIDPPDEHVRNLIAAARDHKVHVIMGMGTFGATIPGDVYNTALLVGPDGVIGAYRKTHVAAFPYSEGISKERCFYSPGKELPVFDTALGRLGIHICYDMSFPEVARTQALKGADLLINVSASAGGFEETWVHGLFMRATENCSWYMVCSVVGIQRGDRLFGGSRVVDPSGKVVAEGKFDEEDVVIADIDPSLTRIARSTSHQFNLRQPRIYSAITEEVPYP
jgi:predicted amidohydrolase